MTQYLKLKSLLPFAIILTLMLGTYAVAYLHPVSWENLKQFHVDLKKFDEQHPIATPLIFMGIYILYALLSLPGIFILSLIAGFLFKQPFSTFYVIIAATTGGSLLFLAARSAFGEIFYRRSNRFLPRLEKGFRENAAHYLLFLRLLPLFPFWIVNLAAAFFGVSFWIFAWTTFVGMIPTVIIYTQAGRGFTCFFECAHPLNALSLLNPDMIFALIGLAFFSLLPLCLHRFKS